MPTLGSQRRSSRKAPLLLGLMVLGGAAGGALYWKKREARREQLARELPAMPPPVSPAPVDAPVAEPVSPLVAAGLARAQIQVDGPLESAVIAEVGPRVGPPLSQVITRALVWWVEMPQDLRRGDTIDVLYQVREGEEPLVHAVKLKSAKHERTFATYRYQPEGESLARFFQPTGEELEARLHHSPIASYEQITSLIRDGRRHKGVDFRAPVGTDVTAPFAGVITRKNWNFRSNGNCLEVTENGTGRKALFLHLDRIPATVRVGDRVSRGEVIAASGNSGRSFAPHLHFQLMSANERVLDPFEVFESYRRKLGPEAQSGLEREIHRLDALLTAPIASR